MARKSSRTRKRGFSFGLFIIAACITLIAGWLSYGLIRQANPGEPSPLVTTTDVNLRSGPDATYPVIEVVAPGTTVLPSGESRSGFRQVSVDGVEGWMSVDYLASASTEAESPELAVHAAEVPDDSSATDVDSSSSSLPNLSTVEAEESVQESIAQEYSQPEHQVTTPAESAGEPAAEVDQPVAPLPQPGEKWIEVNRSTRTVTLHNGEIVVAQFDALIGKDPSADGYYSTAVGTYHVWVMEESLAETPFAKDVYLTHFVGFDQLRSNGFHSPTKDAAGNVVITGGTQTLGCVRLSDENSRILFDFAYIGMRVEVHD